MSSEDASPDRVLFNEREAAKSLSVSPRHLQKLRLEGVAPYVQLGGRVGYTREHLQELVRTNSVKAYKRGFHDAVDQLIKAIERGENKEALRCFAEDLREVMP